MSNHSSDYKKQDIYETFIDDFYKNPNGQSSRMSDHAGLMRQEVALARGN